MPIHPPAEALALAILRLLRRVTLRLRLLKMLHRLAMRRRLARETGLPALKRGRHGRARLRMRLHSGCGEGKLV